MSSAGVCERDRSSQSLRKNHDMRKTNACGNRRHSPSICPRPLHPCAIAAPYERDRFSFDRDDAVGSCRGRSHTAANAVPTSHHEPLRATATLSGQVPSRASSAGSEAEEESQDMKGKSATRTPIPAA